MIKYIVASALFMLCMACQKREQEVIKRENIDFTKDSLAREKIRLVFDLYNDCYIHCPTDTTLVIEAKFSEGWKNGEFRYYKEITDTLKLEDKIFVRDGIEVADRQVLSYTKPNEIYFQLEVKPYNIDKRDTEKYNFYYKGKLFIKQKGFHYFADALYTK